MFPAGVPVPDSRPYLSRHQAGDWGVVDEQERRSNAFGVRHGEWHRLVLSSRGR
jgi:hypothetical protein